MKQLSDHPHTAMIRRIARKLLRRLPDCVELEEVVSDGFIGLKKAIAVYDPSHPTPFERMAGCYIRWEMLEGIRKREVFRKELHYRVRTMQDRVYEQIHPIHRVDQINEADLLLREFPDRTWFILQLHYFEHIPFKRIAPKLGMTAESISMVHVRALRRMRETLKVDDILHASRP